MTIGGLSKMVTNSKYRLVLAVEAVGDGVSVGHTAVQDLSNEQ